MPRANPYHLILLVAAAFLAYSNILNAPFIVDDFGYVSENPWVASPANLLDFSDARYVGFASFALNRYIGGPGVFGFHLVNVAIHAANAVLVYLLVLELFNLLGARGFDGRDTGKGYMPASSGLALAIAVVFVLHPAGVYSVTYISQRFTSLAAFFYLASVLLYMRHGSALQRSRGRWGREAVACYAAAFVSALVAMKTKEISFTLPVVLLVIEFGLLRGAVPTGHPASRGASALRVVPFLLLMLIIPLATIGATIGDGATENTIGEMMRQQKLKDMAAVSSFGYLMAEAPVVLTYMRMLLVPGTGYSACDYSVGGSLADPGLFFPASVVVLVMCAAIYGLVRSIRRRHALLFVVSSGIVWFFITLSVTSSFIPIKQLISGNRVYLPSVGFIAAVVTGIYMLGAAAGRRYRLRLNPVLVTTLVVLALGALTYATNRVWADDERLYASHAEREPCIATHRIHMAMVHVRAGRWAEARRELQAAVSIEPGRVLAWINLAKVSGRMGLIEDAATEYAKVVEFEPDRLEARETLALLYMKLGQLERAGAEVEEVERLSPGTERSAALGALLKRMQSGELAPAELELGFTD